MNAASALMSRDGFGFSAPQHLLVLAACSFLAGLVRGFSGFGLSAVLVASASFVISPRLIIPLRKRWRSLRASR